MKEGLAMGVFLDGLAMGVFLDGVNSFWPETIQSLAEEWWKI